MKIQFLGQGYEPTSEHSVGNHLVKFLSDDGFHTFTGLSAFASQGGINGLVDHIEKARAYIKSITIITGVDQHGTSKEALDTLIHLGIDSYVFYQPSVPIFHPKIYLFEGEIKCELIIGSSNLTVQGLFMNVEASVLISIDNRIEEDRKIVEDLKAYYKGIFDHSDPNLKKLTPELVSYLVDAKIVPTEAERKASQEKTVKNEAENIINKIFPKRAIAAVPKEFRKRPKLMESQSATTKPIKSKPSELLWESGPLTERDLNIPKGSNTNLTGSMLFKKGETQNIDQRHYFRDVVFSSLNWNRDINPRTAHLERATALFKIIIDGNERGDYKLKITHNTETDTRTYKQNNAMTSVSWGEAKKEIAQESLLGKSAYLYKNKGKKDEFTLKIE